LEPTPAEEKLYKKIFNLEDKNFQLESLIEHMNEYHKYPYQGYWFMSPTQQKLWREVTGRQREVLLEYRDESATGNDGEN